MVTLSLKKFLPLVYGLTFIAVLAIVVTGIENAGYHITFATTPSVPKGFYFVCPAKKINRYDIIEFLPPDNILNFIKTNHWVPKNGLVIKYAFALPHDHVCIRNQTIWINGNKIGPIHKFYAKNKRLPQIKLCRTLTNNEYLFLSTKNERSFDSRYFGVVTADRILGKASKILIFPTNKLCNGCKKTS